MLVELGFLPQSISMLFGLGWRNHCNLGHAGHSAAPIVAGEGPTVRPDLHPFQIRVATLIPKLPNLTPLWIRVATLIEFRSLFVRVATLFPREAEHRKLKGALEHRKKWPQDVFF